MRFSMTIGREPEAIPPGAPAHDATAPAAADAQAETVLLEAQLERMRGMLFGYSRLFFETVRIWILVTVALLVLGLGDIVPVAVLLVPFLVPLAFLETGFLFWNTVFARRHAERLERAINERLGREVLVGHRLEAAYFYPPDRPKLAAFSFGNPLGYMSALTAGYVAAATIAWVVGIASSADWARGQGGGPVDYIVPGAIAWTALIAGYLVWAFLARSDEDRLLGVLRNAYRPPMAAPAEAARPLAGGGAPVVRAFPDPLRPVSTAAQPGQAASPGQPAGGPGDLAPFGQPAREPAWVEAVRTDAPGPAPAGQAPAEPGPPAGEPGEPLP